MNAHDTAQADTFGKKLIDKGYVAFHVAFHSCLNLVLGSEIGIQKAFKSKDVFDVHLSKLESKCITRVAPDDCAYCFTCLQAGRFS